MATTNSTPVGAFIPTTNVWDVAQLAYVQDPALRELLVRLYQNINNIANVLNVKDTGYYDTNQFVTSQLFFPNPALSSSTQQNPQYRQSLRLLVNFGQLPNAGLKSVAHGIAFNTAYTITRIYGAASDTTGLNYIPLPYASPVLANNIELNADGTNVNVTTGSNRTNFNICYIILEYLIQ